MSTKQELQEQLNRIQNELDLMDKDEEKFDLERVMNDISCNDISVDSSWWIDDYDLNYFLDEDESEKFENQIKALRVLQLIADFLNKGWTPNFDDDYQYKYSIFKGSLGNIDIETFSRTKFPLTVSFKDKESAEKAIEIMKKYNLLEYLFI